MPTCAVHVTVLPLYYEDFEQLLCPMCLQPKSFRLSEITILSLQGIKAQTHSPIAFYLRFCYFKHLWLLCLKFE